MLHSMETISAKVPIVKTRPAIEEMSEAHSTFWYKDMFQPKDKKKVQRMISLSIHVQLRK